MVSKGDAVVVVAGKKVPLGTAGKVFWTGETKFGLRVGFTDAAGATHWTAMGNVERAEAPAPVVTAPVASSDGLAKAVLALAEALAAKVETLEAKVAALEAALAAPAPFIPDGVDPFDVTAFTH